jgi:GNAT superfamily N-acetyltransferase
MNAVQAIALKPAHPGDFEELLALRIEAMRESLERIGRFDAGRARERFSAGFAPEHTRHVLLGADRVGFVAVKPIDNALLLDHLYVLPRYQGRRIGSQVLQAVFAEADTAGLPMRVGALRGSDSNRFYLRHGFVRVEESEWDIYYARPARLVVP